MGQQVEINVFKYSKCAQNYSSNSAQMLTEVYAKCVLREKSE